MTTPEQADEQPRIELRDASLDDASFVRELRNQPDVRAASFTTEVIAPSTHEAWFADALSNDEVFFYIVEVEGSAVGYVRVSVEKKAEISLAIHHDYRGRGLGSAAIEAATQAVLQERQDLVEVSALVRRTNRTSEGAFERAGYLPCGRILRGGKEATQLVYRRRYAP